MEEHLNKLAEKYEGMGQDMDSYLEGLYHSNGLNYWQYIQVESLLGLQHPRTDFKDEIVFITYHQICELYFKLIKLEISELTDKDKAEPEYHELKNWYKRLERMIVYVEHLCRSFNVMVHCMDKNDFRKFRMALLPASGFQGVSFRQIEIMSTKLYNLLTPDERGNLEAPLDTLYENIYWKKGGFDYKTKNKSLTLLDFEARYDQELKSFIESFRFRNLDYTYNCLPVEMKQDQKLKDLLKDYDKLVNYHWKMSHLASSRGHLVKGAAGTGGTNWDKYLPPDSNFQKITFFEHLWTAEEKAAWGKEEMKKEFVERVSRFW